MTAGLVASVVSYVFRAPQSGVLGSIAHGLAVNASFLPYLLMGTVIFQRYRGGWSTRNTIVVFAFLAILFFENANKGAIATLGPRSACVSYGCALVAFVLLYAGHTRFRYARWIDWLARVSYPLYLVHAINGYVLIFLLSPLLGSYVLAVLIALVLVFLAASVLHSKAEAPLLKLGKRLTAAKPVTAPVLARDHAMP
jgi:peptidoglycan/LPS O-acetylase OafA/YrhL